MTNNDRVKATSVWARLEQAESKKDYGDQWLEQRLCNKQTTSRSNKEKESAWFVHGL